jgi:PAS domain S-box-containing protein
MAKNTESEMSTLKSKISNPQSLRVLMVEDSEDDALLEIRELKKGGYNPVYERVETAAAMKKALKEKQWDIILCDYKLPKFNAPSAIAVLKKTNIDIPLIIVSGAIGEETAVEFMRLGAHDYIMKGNLSRLYVAIARELDEANSRSKRKQAEEALNESEALYRKLFDNHAAVKLMIDPDTGNIIDANDAAANFYGWSREKLKQMKIQEINTLSPEEVKKELEKARTQKRIHFEFRHRRADGSIRNVEVFSSKIEAKGKDILHSIIHDITERKLAEEALKDSEEKYRNIIENIEDGYYEVDFNGNFTFFNDSMCRILGYPQEEMMGMNNRQFTDKENAKKLFKTFNEVYRTGEPAKEFDWQIIRKDGDKRYIEVSVSLQKNSSGKPIGFRGISRDISERKQAEEVLLESEKFFKEITENSSDIIIITDKNGDIKYCSRSIERIAGYRPEELIGRSALTLIHPDDKKRAVGDFGKAILAIDSAIPNAFRIVHKDGSERYFEGLGENLLDNPDVAGFIMNVHDITESKRAEEKLRRSEKKYRSLVENAQEGIFQSTAEGRHISVNQAFANILGYESPEEVMAAIADIPHQVYVHPDDRTKILQIIEKEGLVKGYEAEFYKKDGSKTWMSINMHAIRDEEGRLLYYQGTDQDIIEKKNMETERQENIERLRKSLGVTINAISMIVEMKDPYTSGHQQRVSDLARSIATEMGLSADRQDFLRTASAIHDIGKISVPSEILSKPTKLTDLEFSLIKTHAQSGYDILKDIEFPWPVADVVLQHHERMDGSGYPQGLKGDDILLEARILAVADVVEAIASHRPYRPELGIDFALEEISGNKGILYDADAVDACLKLFREKGYTLVLEKS